MSDKPVSTWTRFQAPPPPDHSRALDTSIFQPLIAQSADYRDAFYGRVAESPDQCVLVVAWNSGAACDAFAASPLGWRQLLANITAAVADTGEVVGDVEPSHQQQKQREIPVITRKVDFEKEPFWANFGSNTEMRTVYFHPAGNGNVRERVMRLKGLVLTVGLGIGSELAHLSPYSGVPARGWVIGESREKEKKDKEEKESSDDGDQASEFVTWEGSQ